MIYNFGKEVFFNMYLSKFRFDSSKYKMNNYFRTEGALSIIR